MRVLTESITKGKANVLLISTQLLAAKALDDRRRRTANCSDVVMLAAAGRLSKQATYISVRLGPVVSLIRVPHMALDHACCTTYILFTRESNLFSESVAF